MLIHFVTLLLVHVAMCSACPQYCTFLWIKNESDNSSSFDVPWKGTTTNVVTIDGTVTPDTPQTGDPSTWIRFRDGTDDEAIAVELAVNNNTNELRLLGSYNGNDTAPVNITDPFTNMINIQISDASADTDNFYKIYTTKSSNLTECSFGSEWDSIYNNVKLSDTQRVIINMSAPHHLNYISVCSTAKPSACSNATFPSSPTLGQDFNLTCMGSGAPYLSTKWAGVTALAHQIEQVYNDSSADHTLSSTLTLKNFTVAHAGQYTCSFYNTNFNLSSSTLTFEVQYQQNYTITAPADDTFTTADNFTLSWSVTGWPLTTLQFSCDNHTNIAYTSDISNSTVTAVYNATFGRDMNDDVIHCVLRNASEVVGETRVYRVGMNCSAGEYGQGRNCRKCGRGSTSVEGSAACFNVSSSCKPNYYGIADNCTACPHGRMSLAETVKIQDCFSFPSSCAVGTYFRLLECTECPFGKTSLGSSVKVEDCYAVTSTNCGVGNYSTAECSACAVECKTCPAGYTSKDGAAKRQDCQAMESECGQDEYGHGTECRSCPAGTVSDPGSETVEECVKNHMVKEIPFILGVGVALLLVACLVMGTFLRFYVKHKRERKDIRVVFSEVNEGNSTVFVNDLSDSKTS